MSKINFETECACGAPLIGSIKKPTRFEHSITKLTCGDCDSRYMLKCERDRKVRDRKVFITNAYLLELSRPCRDIIKKDPMVKARALKESVFGSRPDNSIVETEMD